MAAESFYFSLITPEARLFEGEADFVAIPAHDGEIGILRDRAPLLCRLGAGEMRARLGHDVRRWFIDMGFAQVLNNRVVVLAQRAMKPEQIDTAEVEKQLAEARKMPATDDVSLRHKHRREASARAKLHMLK